MVGSRSSTTTQSYKDAYKEERPQEPLPEEILGDNNDADRYTSPNSLLSKAYAIPAKPTEGHIKRAFHCLHNMGEYSRGLSALNSMPLAPATEETALNLAALHPEGPEVATVRHEKFPVPDSFDVRKLARQFYRGSSGGMSGMTIQHILMCCQSLNYLSRVVGPQPAWRRYDDTILDGSTRDAHNRALLFLLKTRWG